MEMAARITAVGVLRSMASSAAAAAGEPAAVLMVKIMNETLRRAEERGEERRGGEESRGRGAKGRRVEKGAAIWRPYSSY